MMTNEPATAGIESKYLTFLCENSQCTQREYWTAASFLYYAYNCAAATKETSVARLWDSAFTRADVEKIIELCIVIGADAEISINFSERNSIKINFRKPPEKTDEDYLKSAILSSAVIACEVFSKSVI